MKISSNILSQLQNWLYQANYEPFEWKRLRERSACKQFPLANCENREKANFDFFFFSKMKLLTGILLLNLLALSFGQYDFFDDYVKKFIRNLFSGGRGSSNNGSGSGSSRNPNITPGRNVPDLRPQTCDCSFRNGLCVLNNKIAFF